MKNAVIAMLLVFGVSVSASVFACDGSNHSQAKSSASKPVVTAPATAK